MSAFTSRSFYCHKAFDSQENITIAGKTSTDWSDDAKARAEPDK